MGTVHQRQSQQDDEVCSSRSGRRRGRACSRLAVLLLRRTYSLQHHLQPGLPLLRLLPLQQLLHHMTKRDAEAEPQTFTPYYQSAWPYTYPQTAYTNTHHLLPAVRTVAAPMVRTVASPLLKTLMPAAHRTYASVSALPTHHITNYNNAEQFTAHSNGVFGPKYIAKNGPVEHIVKRE